MNGDGQQLILVVDDDEFLSRLLRVLFVERGYRVELADSGRQALELMALLDAQIKLAVLDVHLAGLNGIETMKALRQSLPNLPVLFLSGCDIEPLMHETGVLSPTTACHTKPFDHTELLATVARLLAAGAPPASV